MATEKQITDQLALLTSLETQLAQARVELSRLMDETPKTDPVPAQVPWAWYPLCREGEAFSIPGAARWVKLGWGGDRSGGTNRWMRQLVAGNAVATTKFFGGDPFLGVTKGAQIYRPAVDDGKAVSPTPPDAFAVAGMFWEHAANEGENIPAWTGQVRYGGDGNWVALAGWSGGVCNQNYFNADPAFGRVKTAQRLNVVPMPVSPPSGNELNVTWAQINNQMTVKGAISAGLMGAGWNSAKIVDSVLGRVIAQVPIVGGMPGMVTASFHGIDTTQYANGTYSWVGEVTNGSLTAKTGPLTITIAN